MDWGIILAMALGLLVIGLIVITAGLILMVYDFFEGNLKRLQVKWDRLTNPDQQR